MHDFVAARKHTRFMI